MFMYLLFPRSCCSIDSHPNRPRATPSASSSCHQTILRQQWFAISGHSTNSDKVDSWQCYRWGAEQAENNRGCQRSRRDCCHLWHVVWWVDGRQVSRPGEALALRVEWLLDMARSGVRGLHLFPQPPRFNHGTCCDVLCCDAM